MPLLPHVHRAESYLRIFNSFYTLHNKELAEFATRRIPIRSIREPRKPSESRCSATQIHQRPNCGLLTQQIKKAKRNVLIYVHHDFSSMFPYKLEM
jgi:hypothetical protein